MRITRVFQDTDLRLSFDGLRELIKENNAGLGENSRILFINRARTAFKLLVSDTYLVFYRNGNRRIPLEALVHLPQNFGGSEIEVSAAIRKTLELKVKKQ